MSPTSLKIKGRPLYRVQQRLIKPIVRSIIGRLGESDWNPDPSRGWIRLEVEMLI